MGSALSSFTKTNTVDMDGPAAKFVRDAINKEKVVIFSKSYCPYCELAKEQFRMMSVPVTSIEINERSDADEVQNVLKEITGARTVPRVFINGKFVGGGTDVRDMYNDGRLHKLLQC